MRLRLGGAPWAGTTLVLSLLALVGALAVSWELAEPGSGGVAVAQTADPAIISPINLTGRDHTVRITRDDDGADFTATLGAGDDVPPSHVTEVGDIPVGFESSCTGCATVRFAMASGQRALVFVAAPGDPAVERGDVRVVNESGVRRMGSLRTGEEAGRGRRVLDFDLADGEEAAVGVRLAPGELVALNVSCGGCAVRHLRAANGVDLEIVLR